jgi:hypothetical protein
MRSCASGPCPVVIRTSRVGEHRERRLRNRDQRVCCPVRPPQPACGKSFDPSGQVSVSHAKRQAITPRSPVRILFPQRAAPVSKSRDRGVIRKADAESRRPFRGPGPVAAESCDDGWHFALSPLRSRATRTTPFTAAPPPHFCRELSHPHRLAPPGSWRSCERNRSQPLHVRPHENIATCSRVRRIHLAMFLFRANNWSRLPLGKRSRGLPTEFAVRQNEAV